MKHTLKRVYGLTLEQHDKMRLEQNYCCYICGQHESTQQYKVLSVDHDHATKKIRALLCSWCNHGLGKFKDDLELLEKAVLYLKKFKGIK